MILRFNYHLTFAAMVEFTCLVNGSLLQLSHMSMYLYRRLWRAL